MPEEVLEREVPVYIVAGFLDAGKTEFARDLLTSEDFCEGERILFLRCEDGEEEYDEAELAKYKVKMVPIEDREDFTLERLTALEKAYDPEMVVIEYNGMWPLSMIDDAFPQDWVMYQLVMIIEAATFESYSRNMGQLMMEKVMNADTIVFNRCTPELKESLRKRNLKLVNRMAAIYLEDPDGEGEDYFLGGELPFDLSGPVLQLEGNDYGVFYADAMDYPEHYEGKSVEFVGMVAQSKDFPKGYCAVGRFAMVCCSEDMQFLGMLCKGPEIKKFNTRDWVRVRGVCRKEYQEVFGEDGPTLYIESMEACPAPAQEVIGF